MDLALIWFGLIVLSWVLFLVLDGFDFGVGILAPVIGRDSAQRGAALRTIAPVWDGNEVWLVTAVGATFAAFPDWYASLMSGLYLPMVALLLTLAVRGVALEFRGKKDSESWRRRLDLATAVSSALTAAILGAILGVLSSGLTLGPDGEVHSSSGSLSRTLGPLMEPAALIGAALGVLVALMLGASYLALRTTGPVRERARQWMWGTAGTLTTIVAVVTVVGGWPWPIGLALALILGATLVMHHRGREGWAFALSAATVAIGVVAVLTHHFPVLMPSTLDAQWSLTIEGSAASRYALSTISWAALFILPAVLAYQGFAYWVFRRRVTSEPVPT